MPEVGYGIEEEGRLIMREASEFERLSRARAVVDLKFGHIRIHVCTSSTSRSRLVHYDRQSLYVTLRPGGLREGDGLSSVGWVRRPFRGIVLVATNRVTAEC